MKYKKTGRARMLKSRYGLSEEKYNELFTEQNGECALCFSKTEKYLDVDHNHKTGKIRALLCNNCNRGLGHFKEDQVVLARAISYLDKYQYEEDAGGAPVFAELNKEQYEKELCHSSNSMVGC